MADVEEKRAQVAKQCRAIAHMATALAHVHAHKAGLHESGDGDGAFLDLVGRWTAERMEVLGNMLNGMDAVDEVEDAWLDPVFEEAKRRWPIATAGILWCCHVRGPDDVHAAPDYATALAWSDRFNDFFATLTKREFDPIIRAAPAIYPWGEQSHAEALPKCLEQFADGKLP